MASICSGVWAPEASDGHLPFLLELLALPPVECASIRKDSKGCGERMCLIRIKARRAEALLWQDAPLLGADT